MLLDEDARRKRLGTCRRHARHRGLQNDRTGVEVGGHEMDGGPGHLHAMVQRLALRVDARERRQERRVDVENRVGKCVEKRCPDQPHETGQADE